MVAEVEAFLDRQAVKSVVMTGQLIGCPHEEGKDYPNGRAVGERNRQARRRNVPVITIAQEGT